MLKIFSGDDTYSSYNAAKEYAQHLSSKQNLPLEIVDADEYSLNQLLQKTQNIGMFSKTTVLMAKRLLDNKYLSEYVANQLDSVIGWPMAIWHEGKLDKRKAYVKNLQARKLIEEFNSPKVWEVERWLATQIANLKVPASQAKPYATQLILTVGDDRWRLSNELRKLELYLLEGQKLPPIETLVGTDVAGDIWKFLDALALGDKKVAAQEFKRLTKFAETDQYLIAMLTRELSLLHDYLQTDLQGGNSKSLKLHPFVLDKLSKKAKRFTLQKVQKLTQALMRLDMAIKSGAIKPDVALTLYMLSW